MKRVVVWAILLFSATAMAVANTPTPTCTPEKGMLFYPLPQCRVFETRPSQPVAAQILVGTPLGNDTLYSYRFQGGICGIPKGAAAAFLHFTAVNQSVNGWVKVGTHGVASSLLPVVNFKADGTFDSSNGVGSSSVILLAKVSGATDPDVDIYYHSENFVPATTDFIVDVNGYYLPDCDFSGDDD